MNKTSKLGKKLMKLPIKKYTTKVKTWKSQRQFLGPINIDNPHHHDQIVRRPDLLIDSYAHYDVSLMTMDTAIDVYQTKCGVPSIQSSMVIKDIRRPAPGHIIDMANKIKEEVEEILPSLRSLDGMKLGVTGSAPDIGRVAMGHPECMLSRARGARTEATKRGNDGFRVIISTDHHSGGSSWGPAIMALNYTVAKLMPCEIYIQQGWLGSYHHKGNREGTVNLVRMPDNMDPGLLWFWCDSAYKDGEFSGTIAQKYLKSGKGGVSKQNEIPCDVFSQSDHMNKVAWILKKEGVQLTGHKLAAMWIAFLVSEKFMSKDPLDNKDILRYLK
jgi:hypothetical protein